MFKNKVLRICSKGQRRVTAQIDNKRKKENGNNGNQNHKGPKK